MTHQRRRQAEAQAQASSAPISRSVNVPDSPLSKPSRMAPLHRKYKQVQLRQAWHRDPAAVIAKYLEAVGGDNLDKSGHADISLAQMIDAIIDRELSDLSTSTLMRAIAA